MIENHHRQALKIIQAHIEAVSWCPQLFVSACERADPILYSDQHTVALLMASLSWKQHTFCCIGQIVLIGCQYFWCIFFDVFFCDPAIMGHILS